MTKRWTTAPGGGASLCLAIGFAALPANAIRRAHWQLQEQRCENAGPGGNLGLRPEILQYNEQGRSV